MVAPVLDGQCEDSAYPEAGRITLVDALGRTATPATLLHTGLDFYICLHGLPSGVGQRIAVRLDSDHSRDTALRPGDYQFRVTADGALSVGQGSATGAEVPLTVPANDFAAVVSPTTGERTWNAELRIGLEWFGGYARIDGFSVAVEQADGTVLQQWPPGAHANSPATWGELTLAPLYPDPLSAGSAFLDGREGYLVVPYTPELNPLEIIIEAWVKVVDDDCGTLVGNGQAISYWLGLCHVVQLGIDGPASVRRGQHPLGPGWHHIAVTVNPPKGIRTYYRDGEIDVQPGWRAPHEEEEEVKNANALGVSDRMLRIGSDRQARGEVNHLHGYVRELRIWNRERSAQEIRDGAFRNLSGTEPGLVALWPFVSGLQDVAGGHHAGLIGNASLARETRDVTAFPPRAVFSPYTYPGPEPVPSWDAVIPRWDAVIPHGTRPPTLDGICRPAEYAQAAKLILEPNHHLSMRLLQTAEAFYLCTGVLFGRSGSNDAVTVWIDRDGRGGEAPGAGDLRLRLTPDGTLTAGTGDGRDYTGPAPEGLASRTIGDTRLALQDDVRPVNAPWWAGEVRIPFAALAPHRAGEPLRFAVLAEGTLPSGALPTVPQDTVISGRWPAAFDEQRPSTWGVAITSVNRVSLPSAATAPADVAPRHLAPNPPPPPPPPPSPSPPTPQDFYNKCPDWWFQPGHDAGYVTDPVHKWPKVAPSKYMVQAEGTLTYIGLSNQDSPFIHNSHDFDMKLSVAAPFRWLVIDGGANLVLESESDSFDPEAIPNVGDHVTAKGRWIFDCGHAPKTEIHPIVYFESDREEWRPTGLFSWPTLSNLDETLQLVRVARVRMTSNPGAFTYNFNDIGPFEFDLAFPQTVPAYKMPFLRVVRGPANTVAVTGFDGTTAHISITPPIDTGYLYYEIFAGYFDTWNAGPPADGIVRVHFDDIEILDDLDDASSGEWYMYIAVNGAWLKVLQGASVDDDHPPYSIPAQLPNPSAFTDAITGDLILRVIGYENDDPFAGNDIGHGYWDQGPLAQLCCNKQHQLAPSGAHWKLRYTVSESSPLGLEVMPFGDTAFWKDRLIDEPNEQYAFHLGTIHVPPLGAPPHITTHASFLTEAPFEKSGVRVLSGDIDKFDFKLDEFAHVDFWLLQPLPAGLEVTMEDTDDYYAGVPQDIVDKIGYRGARVNIHRVSGPGGDQPYTLQIQTTWRELPPDWGEDDDAVVSFLGQGGGRLVDLVTPDPATGIFSDTYYSGAVGPVERRVLGKDWAWQHIPQDIDY
jgi:hypothetical protein